MIAIDSERQPSIERLHSRGTWARDLAIVGAVSALPLAWWEPSEALLLAALAALGGALVGLAVPLLLHRRVRNKPLVLLAPAAVGLGALWGGTVAALAAPVVGAPVLTLVALGASVGAAQLGWLWLPYALSLARFGTGRWVVLAACALAPAIGWLACLHVFG